MAETKSQDAIALLKQDHREVEELFEEFEKANGDGRKQKLAHKICLELSVHAAIEEEIFYPACEGKVEEDLLKEGYVEHDAAKLLIAEIEAGGGAGRRILRHQGQGAVRKRSSTMSRKRKSRGGIFAQARKAELDMDALGEQLAARKQELTEQFKASGIPSPS